MRRTHRLHANQAAPARSALHFLNTGAAVAVPSYKQIAAKYAGDSGAAAKLQQKIKTGGSGVWGAIPMPPNNVPART